MSYIEYNENPCGKHTIDCTVRALSTLLDMDWEQVFVELCSEGYLICEMPSSKATVHAYLADRGFKRSVIPNQCPACYTVRDFANDHPTGKYLLATDSHVVPVISGNYIDTWDSGSAIPIFYWEKGSNDA